tara:strand:- start:324110 stop:324496 length:387 start_codon:yes stop_codon:yes gene_type:complete
MSLKAHFQEASQNLSTILFHAAIKTDGRIIGPLYKSLQDFVVAAKAQNITPNVSTAQPSQKLDIDSLQDLARTVGVLSGAKGQVDEDLTDAVQDLVNKIHDTGVTADSTPVPVSAPKIAPQMRPIWGN